LNYKIELQKINYTDMTETVTSGKQHKNRITSPMK